ncbi:DUF3299 domain-containing protein [Eionea flava]
MPVVHAVVAGFCELSTHTLCKNALSKILTLVLACLFFLTAQASTVTDAATIEWVDLIPPEDLKILTNPPKSITDIPHGQDFPELSSEFPSGDELDQFSNSITAAIGDAVNNSAEPLAPAIPSPEEQAYAAALKSTNVNKQFDQQNIRLPGFVVPVEYNDDQVITEFFLVPYFGACIHVPPPPPNQIIYVKYPQGLQLTALYDPFWIEGQMKTELVENNIALSAYSIDASNIKPYEEYQN